MKIRIYLSTALFLLGIGSCTAPERKEYDWDTGKLYIDNEEWTFVWESTHCSRYVDAAVQEYWKQRVYSKHRPLDLEYVRFLVNDNEECWVAVDVLGASTFSYLFRVNENNEVIDKRQFSKRSPHVSDYPAEPYEN